MTGLDVILFLHFCALGARAPWNSDFTVFVKLGKFSHMIFSESAAPPSLPRTRPPEAVGRWGGPCSFLARHVSALGLTYMAYISPAVGSGSMTFLLAGSAPIGHGFLLGRAFHHGTFARTLPPSREPASHTLHASCSLENRSCHRRSV